MTHTIDPDLLQRIADLKRERGALILAHNYQPGPIQDLADRCGDSLGLSRMAAEAEEPVILFCGVHFMAETAAILCPEKTILLPVQGAGCSLAESITAAQLRAWKAQHPGACVVSYVNTTAEIKAESDICCTSSNAVEVVQAQDPDRPILFLPDRNLGRVVELLSGRKLHCWPGACHVHQGIEELQVAEKRVRYPEAEVIMHPECPVAARWIEMHGMEKLRQEGVFILSTGGMMRHVRESHARQFIVVTEVDTTHALRRQRADAEYIPVSFDTVCEYMKLICPDDVLRSLEHNRNVIEVERTLADRARQAIEKMLEIG